jgi:hypothetical protein
MACSGTALALGIMEENLDQGSGTLPLCFTYLTLLFVRTC